MRLRPATTWPAALAALALAGAAVPAPTLARGPVPATLAPSVALPPGRAACATATGPLAVARDLSGFGVRSASAPPVLLSPSLVAYLQSDRRPLPHVAAVVAATTAGTVVWRDAVAATADPGALAYAGGSLDLALRAGAGVRLEALAPADGALRFSRRLDWHADGPAPGLTPDGRGGLLVSGPTSDLPAALSGLDSAQTPLVDLTARFATRWRDDGVGDLLALSRSVAVAGVRVGPGHDGVRLSGIALASGRLLWRRTLAPGAPPSTASFGVSRGVLVWAVTWPGGGRAGALSLASGKALWQVPTRLADWLAAGAAAVAGPAPWQPPSALAARALATGAVLWRGPAATPLAFLGGRLLALGTTPASGAMAWLWLVPPPRASASALAVAQAAGVRAGPAPLPPVALYCPAAGGGAVLLAPARAGDLWSVAAGVAQAAGSG